jgi:hypothetical protein
MVDDEHFDHDILYQQGREQIEVAYLQAMNRSVVDPVVIVMDLREPLVSSQTLATQTVDFCVNLL